MDQVEVFSQQEQLDAIIPGNEPKRGLGGSQDFQPASSPGGLNESLKLSAYEARALFGEVPVSTTKKDPNYPGIGGKSKVLPSLKLLTVKFFKFALGRKDKRRTLGVHGLDEHHAIVGVAPCSSADLGYKSKGSLGAPKVGHVEPGIRKNKPHQAYTGKIEPLGNHLGSQKNVDFSFAESIDDRFHCALGGRRIAV